MAFALGLSIGFAVGSGLRGEERQPALTFALGERAKRSVILLVIVGRGNDPDGGGAGNNLGLDLGLDLGLYLGLDLGLNLGNGLNLGLGLGLLPTVLYSSLRKLSLEPNL